MLYHPKERESAMYNMEDFYEELISNINNTYRQTNTPNTLVTAEGDITMDSYVNFFSVIYNQSRLGFYKERGGISF